jgi:hypothetical protein
VNKLSLKRRAIVLRICERGVSTKSPEAGAAAGAVCVGAFGASAGAAVAGAAVVAGLADGLNSSTSRFTMRPLSPLPSTWLKLIPFSSARRFARGEALIRSPESATETLFSAAASGAACGVCGCYYAPP